MRLALLIVAILSIIYALRRNGTTFGVEWRDVLASVLLSMLANILYDNVVRNELKAQ